MKRLYKIYDAALLYYIFRKQWVKSLRPRWEAHIAEQQREDKIKTDEMAEHVNYLDSLKPRNPCLSFGERIRIYWRESAPEKPYKDA